MSLFLNGSLSGYKFLTSYLFILGSLTKQFQFVIASVIIDEKLFSVYLVLLC